jgi:hypothetical protein
MKKKIFLISILTTFMLILLPNINAIQKNVYDEETENITINDIKQMDEVEIVSFIIELSKVEPELHEEIINEINELEYKEKTTSPINSNQSIIQKIWQLIYQYRMIRFSLSAIIYITMPSKITMMRTLTWSIKLIRWMKIGVLLGTIDPNFWRPPETPQIIFDIDKVNNTLTVEDVYPNDVLWSDIDQIGSGSCDPFPSGTIAPGDVITNCQGILVLRYKLTNGIIGIYEFD